MSPLFKLLALAVLPQFATAEIILTYNVAAYSSPGIPACQVDSPPSLWCSPVTTGAFTNTISLTPGVVQIAELMPMTITTPPASMLNASSNLFTTIDLSFTDTATGRTGSLHAPLNLSYVTGTPYSWVYDFGESGNQFYTSGLSLRITPTGLMGPSVPGLSVTYPVLATFQTPYVPEPGTAILVALGAALCWTLRRRK